MKRVDAVRKYLELGGESVLVLRNRTEFSLKASNKDRIAMARLPDDHFRALGWDYGLSSTPNRVDGFMKRHSSRFSVIW
jgi:hypothetical protein